MDSRHKKIHNFYIFFVEGEQSISVIAVLHVKRSPQLLKDRV